MKRRRLTKAEWNELYERQAGMCALCHEPLDDDPALGPTEDDHNAPHALNGGEEIDNRQLVHAVCHSLKTNVARPDAPLLGSDKRMVAKANRLRKALAGEKKRKGRALQSRPFEKRFRRKISGKTERRDE